MRKRQYWKGDTLTQLRNRCISGNYSDEENADHFETTVGSLRHKMRKEGIKNTHIRPPYIRDGSNDGMVKRARCELRHRDGSFVRYEGAI